MTYLFLLSESHHWDKIFFKRREYWCEAFCRGEEIFLKILTEVTCKKDCFCSWCPLFAVYSTILKLIDSEGFVTFRKFIKATFTFLNVLQVVIKQRIPCKENREHFLERLVSVSLILLKSVKTKQNKINWKPLTQDSLLSTGIEKKINQIQTIQFFHGCYTV